MLIIIQKKNKSHFDIFSKLINPKASEFPLLLPQASDQNRATQLESAEKSKKRLFKGLIKKNNEALNRDFILGLPHLKSEPDSVVQIKVRGSRKIIF